MEQHLASQWYRARAAAAEFRSNFAMLEAMHEDSEEDFVWSGMTIHFPISAPDTVR